MKIDNSIKELWALFITDKATPEQVNALFEQIKSSDDIDHIAFIKEAIVNIPGQTNATDDMVIDSLLEAIISSNDDLRTSLNKSTQPPVIKRMPILRKWGWAAAAAIFFGGMGAYYWTINKKDTLKPVAAVKASDIKPGRNGGILTLADGRQIVLDSAGNGVIATQSGAQVLLKNGQLAYVATGETTAPTAYNTVTTPKGRQVSLLLPDGTKAWLNAASSLRYPTLFTGDLRQVDVTGEVYFEVAKNARMPFQVIVNNEVKIEVLGTQFNVDAYQNETNISTTLLEGAINVSILSPSSVHGKRVTLKPGEQALVAGAGSKTPSTPEETKGDIKIVEANVDKTMAWKNGLFYFDGVSLYDVMQQIERWYDIEVVIEKGVRNGEFVGKLTRDITLDELLEGFKEFGIHYKLEGRKLTVLP